MFRSLARLAPAALLLALPLLGPTSARAGATLQITDDAKIDLDFRLQSLYMHTQKDLDGDGKFEEFDDFKVRRARIRLGAEITQWVGMFIQTEFAEGEGTTGADMRVIDAFIELKPHPLAHLIVGENMAPVTRQNLTSSGGLMAIDRPGITYKNLTWGTRALYAFSNTNYSDSDAGLRGDVDVRDTGATLFGSTSLTDLVHLKYYLGVYDGVQKANQDDQRYAGRVQVNFFEPEAGYYNLSTYLGKKKTVGIGGAFDLQSAVAQDAGGDKAEYHMYTVDAFADYPLGPGSLTAEAAWLWLDLDDATALDLGGAAPVNAKQSQGNGYYVQAGYYIDRWQPWAEYEHWESDGPNDLGTFDTFRVGLSYFIAGHNANLKAGYEYFKADQNLTGTTEDTVHTFVTGLYVTY